MNIGNQILNIRKEKQLTQEEFGRLFHVTRQTVSNWENEKSYPDLQMLIDISNQFEISLDTLIKEDSKMVKTNCSLLAFTRFHTSNCSDNCWTCNDWNWLV